MEEDKRLPRSYVWTVIALCVLPTLAHLAGADFGSPPIDPPAVEGENLVDRLHVALTGSFVHTILEWSFGPLPDEVQRQLQALEDPEELDRLSDRLLEARSLEELGLAV